MKRLLIVLGLLMSVLLFSSCEERTIREGRKAYKNHFNGTLKDPSSLKIYSEEIISKDDVSATFVLDVGAKNSFGGYVRKTYTIKTIGVVVADVKDCDIRSLPKLVKSKEEKVVSFKYKNKIVPSVVTIDNQNFAGKSIVLRDDILAGEEPYDLIQIIKAVKDNNNEDFNLRMRLGCDVIKRGERIVIDSCITDYNLNTGERESFFAIKYKGKNMVIEQSAAF